MEHRRIKIGLGITLISIIFLMAFIEAFSKFAYWDADVHLYPGAIWHVPAALLGNGITSGGGSWDPDEKAIIVECNPWNKLCVIISEGGRVVRIRMLLEGEAGGPVINTGIIHEDVNP